MLVFPHQDASFLLKTIKKYFWYSPSCQISFLHFVKRSQSTVMTIQFGTFFIFQRNTSPQRVQIYAQENPHDLTKKVLNFRSFKVIMFQSYKF